MDLKFILVYIILDRSYGRLFIDMILDYFEYKKAPSVIGLTCSSSSDDALLIRILSKINVKSMIYNFANESIMKKIANKAYWRTGIFFDTECYDSEIITSIFLEATNYKMYDELYHWLVIGENLDEILRKIDDQAFGTSTDFVIAVLTNFRRFDFYDVYNIFKHRGGTLNVSYFGYWNCKNHISVSLKQSKLQRRANLYNLTLKIAFFKLSYYSANESLVNYLDNQQDAARDGRSKFGYHLLNYLSNIYNFTLELFESLEWEPGDKLGPVIRALLNDTADISGTPLIISGQRTYLVKYVHQDWPFRTCFIFRNPQQTNVKVQEIFRPFADMVWSVLGLTVAICLSILTLLLRYDFNDSRFLRMSHSFIVVIGALCQQSTDIQLKQTSSRIGFITIMLFSLIIYNYYSASVVSARLDEPIYKINDSLSELSKLNMKLASEWMVYLDYFIKLQDWETKIFYQSWLKVNESEKFLEPEIGIKLMQNGGFAYHLHPDVGYPFIEKSFSNREVCELMEVHLGRPTYTAFTLQMNSSLVELMKIGMTKIAEVGLRNRLIIRHQNRKPRCRKDILSVASITIDEFAPHLILLIIGIGLSILIYIVEILFDKKDIHTRKWMMNIMCYKFNEH